MNIIERQKLFRKTPKAVWNIVDYMKKLKALGMKDDEIFNTLKETELPLSHILYIGKYYHDLMAS